MVKRMKVFVTVMTSNWTTFKDKEPSYGCKNCMKEVPLIMRVSYEIGSYF